jgi:uncharacterized protein
MAFDWKVLFQESGIKQWLITSHPPHRLMDKKEIINAIRSNKPEMESHYGVQRLGLFGSYVKGRQQKESDIDILVTFSRDIDLFDFLDLREFLESRFNAKVDLVMESALKPAIGKRILSEVEYV